MINSRSTADLHASLARGGLELGRRMAGLGYPMLVTCTYRDGEAQNALYAQGRTTPGKIVTNAKAGQSIHNYRLAFDICKNVKGQEYSDAGFFAAAGRIWTEMGGEWGGSWASFPDRPHFQFTGGLSLSQLQKGARMPENAVMKWEQALVQGAKGEDDEVIERTMILMNGKEISVERIFKNDTNYIRLRDLERLGLAVGFDESRKIPTITSVNA